MSSRVKNEELIEVFKGIAVENIRRDGNHSPMLLCIDTDNGRMEPILLTDLMNDKDKVVELIGLATMRFGLVVFICEAWLAKVPKDTPLASLPQPSKSPDRKEVLMMSFYEGNKETHLLSSIIREGNTARLGEWQDMGDSQGRFCRVMAQTLANTVSPN